MYSKHALYVDPLGNINRDIKNNINRDIKNNIGSYKKNKDTIDKRVDDSLKKRSSNKLLLSIWSFSAAIFILVLMVLIRNINS
jgi:hypothetical protein